jgi:hypothetical protein
MTLAMRARGGLLVHNAIALEEPLMREIEAFGRPEILVVPNGFHRLDANVYKARYPELRVLAPAGQRKRVQQVVAVDGSYEDVPKDDAVRCLHLEGVKQNEGVVEVRSPGGTTLVFNDVIANHPKLRGVWGVVLAPTGQPGIPRVIRMLMIKDKAKLRAHLEQLAALPDLRRVIVSHGKMLTDPAAELRTALTSWK